MRLPSLSTNRSSLKLIAPSYLRFIQSLAVCAILVSCEDQNSTMEFNLDLIPKPQSIKVGEGIINLKGTGSIEGEDDFESAKIELTEFLKTQADLSLAEKEEADILILLQRDPKTKFPREGYRLETNNNGIRLYASTSAGMQRGLTTLRQLILLNSNGYLPAVEIEDWPTFVHRGLLLDCSRHFFEPEVVKKYIDLLALYKMNTLHWHLTEDQGWRIAINKYPKLTEVGAYRTERDGNTYGGFYTKDQIRDIVAYAASKQIEVIPEIEMPGHSQAALAAYPQLSCTGDSIAVANDWGVFKEIYCAGNDSVFIFLEDVLTEVMELFPSRYIHIGGDEAPKTRWEACEKCQARMKAEGLTHGAELQSYFIRRIQKFLSEKGKQIIGWDEILEGGLAKGAIVQSWRGMDGGIKAVKHGNKAIMSPTSHSYFDYGLNSIDLEKVYSFNPVPAGLSPDEQKLIVGGECNIWTEHVPDEKTLDSKVFPRLLAMAEVLWSDSSSRDFSEFTNRVQSHYPILEGRGVRYGKESVAMSHQMEFDEGNAYLKLSSYSEDISLTYRYDCHDCDPVEKEYKGPIPILKSGIISIQPYKNERFYGDSIHIPVVHHAAINAKVDYVGPFSEWYTAGGNQGLVDGKLGTLDFRDGNWQGFQGHDLECTLQLYSPAEISNVTAHFFQYNNAWIFIPTKISIEVSDDGENWTSWGTAESKNEPEKRGKYIQSVKVESNSAERVIFIRLTAQNIGKVPDWHEAAGSDAWLFIDEIIAE